MPLDHPDPRVVAYAALGIGLVYVGSCDETALTCVTDPLIRYDAGNPNYLKFGQMMALGLGLIFLSQQSRCEVALTILDPAIQDPTFSSFVRATVSSCAFAGTGNVLEIQKNLAICTGPDSIAHAAAVIGLSVIAIGDSVGCQMCHRMFEHVMQYGRPFARRMVPIGMALTSVSNPQPELIDALHRIAHDADLNVANNAAIAMGLLASGTQNSRAIDALRRLSSFHKSNPPKVMCLQIAEGLTHLGQGLMTLSPTYGGSTLLHPVGLGRLLTLAYGCIEAEEFLIKTDPLVLFFVAPAIGPGFSWRSTRIWRSCRFRSG
jgi:26S proteasome regulatory subunit N1